MAEVTSVLDERIEAGQAGEYEIACERNLRYTTGKPPTLADLLAYVEKYGTESVLESAEHLPRDQYEILKTRITRANKRASKSWMPK